MIKRPEQLDPTGGDDLVKLGEFGPLDSYAIGTVRASVPVGAHLEVFGRIENVTDADYATAGDYGTAGRSAFVGVRAKM